MTAASNDLNIAWTLLGQQRFSEAASQAQAVLRKFPDNVSALSCHAMANWKAGGDIDRSIEEMRRAVILAPDVATIRHNLATLLASRGEMVEAAAEFREALRIKPDDTLAFYGLTQNEKFREETDLVRSMAALQAGSSLDATRREFVDFGLAKVYDDLGVPEPAMTYAIEANGLVKRPFDIAGEGAALDELRALTRLDAFRKVRNGGHPSRAPLFIVGMNRSGTTLVESILSRHPDVHAQGEMGQMFEIELSGYQRLGPAGRKIGRHEMMLGLGPDWLLPRAEAVMRNAVAKAGRPFQVMTDKLPENAVRLGLISRLFPNARAIHVRRHPLDTGISNFFQRFSVGQGYSYRMDWIGVRTRQIADSMALWKQALDFPILDVSYERLVSNPEAESRRIVEFAGLEWSPACLEPQRTQRSVLTASQWQVRQPIYRGSIGRWQRYGPWLEPMTEAMGGFDWIASEVGAL